MKLQVTMTNGNVETISGDKIVQVEDYIMGWLDFEIDSERLIKFNPDSVAAFSIVTNRGEKN